MIPLTPALVIATANAFVGLGTKLALEECFLREVWAGAKAASVLRWDTAFVHHVGYWSHYHHKAKQSSWPLPPTATPPELAQIAAARDALVDDPMPGDLFLLWSPAREEFLRTGIVVEVGKKRRKDLDGSRYRECVTIEGDTDPTMARGGGAVLRHERRLSSARTDRFVRWTALDARAFRAREAERPYDVLEDLLELAA